VQAWRRRGGADGVGLLALALLAGACGLRQPADAGMQIRFEDHAEPGVFERTGTAQRDKPDGAPGMWAAVPGLPRPERAEIVKLDTGDKAVVALFRTGGGTIRLSNEAADAVGVTAGPTKVRVTAVRSLPEIAYGRVTTSGRF
jgi:hypothetical protein